MASVSIRRGKLAPSTRKKPPYAYGASDTRWRMGVDAPSFATTYGDSCGNISEAKYEQRRIVNKNESDKVFDGSYRAPPSDPRFSTVARMELTQTVHTSGYSMRHPEEGFDRLTANRTNCNLGDHVADYATSSAELQTKHPQKQSPVEQPGLGGPVREDGSYRTDLSARDSVRRGGGGGEGVLGVRFDIINGQENTHARANVAMRTGPRRTLNNFEREILHRTDGWGDAPGGSRVDILTGQKKKPLEAPARGAGAPVRSDTAVGRTRPW